MSLFCVPLVGVLVVGEEAAGEAGEMEISIKFLMSMEVRLMRFIPYKKSRVRCADGYSSTAVKNGQ